MVCNTTLAEMKSYFALQIFANIFLIAMGISTALAQTTIRGAVLQDGTKERIEQVEIRNLRSGQTVHSNAFGLFAKQLVEESYRASAKRR